MKTLHSILLLILVLLTFSCKDDEGNDDSNSIQFPTADFNIENNNCTAPCITSFTSTSTGGDLSYSWDFGDGNVAGDESSTNNTFVNSGNYDVKLIVQNAKGTEEVTKQVSIQVAAPIAAFNIENNYCIAPCTVSFNSSSIGEDISVNWDFGDGSVAGNETSTSHTFTSPGAYDVKLTAENSSGFTESIKQVTILDPSLDKVSFNDLTFTQLPFDLSAVGFDPFEYQITDDQGLTIKSGSFNVNSPDDLPYSIPSSSFESKSDRIDKAHTFVISSFILGQNASFEFIPQQYPPDYPSQNSNCKEHSLSGSGVGLTIEFCWHED